jgi:hypothetical protein
LRRRHSSAAAIVRRGLPLGRNRRCEWLGEGARSRAAPPTNAVHPRQPLRDARTASRWGRAPIPASGRWGAKRWERARPGMRVNLMRGAAMPARIARAPGRNRLGPPALIRNAVPSSKGSIAWLGRRMNPA